MLTGLVDTLLDLPPYSKRNDEFFLEAVKEELRYHCASNPQFKLWCNEHGFSQFRFLSSIRSIPFLPVQIFKQMNLCSVPKEKIIRTITSSATSSQTPSTIFLDTITAMRQMRALSNILQHLLGNERRPFIIFDAPPTNDVSTELSARRAGMSGFLMAASSTHYVMYMENEVLTLNDQLLRETIRYLNARSQPFCLLGYTYILSQYVLRELRERSTPLAVLYPGSKILHFGGWKRLQHLAVTPSALRSEAAQCFGISPHDVRDIYGFTEQLGVIYPDDEAGIKQVPVYSEVLVRDPRTLECVPDGEIGLLEFVSPIPHGYPGVAILLDDLGRIVSRKEGIGFEVIGRAPKSETRGCGDTLPSNIYSSKECA